MRKIVLCLGLFSALALAQPQTIDYRTLRALQEVQKEQEAGNLDKAMSILAGVEVEPGSYAQAMLWRSEAYLVWQRNHYAHALQLLEKSHASGLLGAEEMAEDRMALARLNLQLDKPEPALRHLARVQESREQLELSIYAWQLLERYDKALPLAVKYLAGEQQISEQWLGFMVAANAGLKRYAQAEKWQKQLLARHPQQVRHWRQLAAIQQQADDYPRAFATLRTAYQQGLEFNEGELEQLIAMASAANQPWQGAKILARLLQQGRLADSLQRQERLAQLQWQAREKEAALEYYRKLAQRSQQAQHWMTVVQLASEQENWALAKEALQAADKSGAARKQVRSWQSWLEASATL